MRLACCSGAEAERWQRTQDHVQVACAICGRTFCMDRKDAEAEEWYRTHSADDDGHTRVRKRPLPSRNWYCSLECLNVQRRRIAEDEVWRRQSRPEAQAGSAEVLTLGTSPEPASTPYTAGDIA